MKIAGGVLFTGDLPANAGHTRWLPPDPGYPHGALRITLDGDDPTACMIHRLSPTDHITYDDNGYLHSFDDQPALAVRPRPEPEPAVKQVWFRHGLLHRDGGAPAVIEPDYMRMWAVDGQYRNPDPTKPTVIWSDGTRCWTDPGDGYTLHRLTGPAVEHSNKASPQERWAFFRHGVAADGQVAERLLTAWTEPVPDAVALDWGTDPWVAGVLLNSPIQSLTPVTRTFLSLAAG